MSLINLINDGKAPGSITIILSFLVTKSTTLFFKIMISTIFFRETTNQCLSIFQYKSLLKVSASMQGYAFLFFTDLLRMLVLTLFNTREGGPMDLCFRKSLIAQCVF